MNETPSRVLGNVSNLDRPVESQNSTSKKITIEVIYALPNKQEIISLEVDNSCTVEQVIKLSKVLETYPELDFENIQVGIFSKKCKLTDNLHDFDRIEIYRPLIIDPKQARKNRANKS